MIDIDKKLICFDCDGVLKDSEKPVTRAFAAQIRCYGLAITDAEAYAQFKGKNAPSIRPQIEQMFAAQSIPVPEHFDCFIRDAEARVFDCLSGIPDIPGALDAVKSALAGGYDVRVVTNSKRAELNRKFQNTDFDRLFPASHRHTADDVTTGKPAPDLYRLAAAASGVPLSRCIAVEDSAPGVRAACAAPMACIGVALENEGAELRDAGAYWIIHNMRDLAATLRRWDRGEHLNAA